MLLQNLQGAQFFLDTVFMLLLNHFTFLCFNCFCLCIYQFSLRAKIYNKIIVSVSVIVKFSEILVACSFNNLHSLLISVYFLHVWFLSLQVCTAFVYTFFGRAARPLALSWFGPCDAGVPHFHFWDCLWVAPPSLEVRRSTECRSTAANNAIR